MGGLRARGPGAGVLEESEDGFTLVEVIVAGLILILVLIPSALLLSNSTTVLTVNQAKLVAANLASGMLDQDRALADAAGWSGTPAVPGLSTTAVRSTVNGVTFTVAPSVGWCALSSGAWGTYSVAPAYPPAYSVLVKVTWLGTHVLTEGEMLTTPSSVVTDGVGGTGGAAGTSSSCPLASTS